MQKAVHPIKSLPLSLLGLAFLGLPPTARAQEYDEVIKSFEDNGKYVEPLATLFGSMTNSGWYQSAGVKGLFGFYFGVPISFISVSDDDRTYSGTFTDDGCILYHKDFPDGNECRDQVGFKAPTLFGRDASASNRRTLYDPNEKKIVGTMDIPLSDGLSDVASFNWFPFLMPQVGFSAFNTEVKLRYIGLPIGDYSFQSFGVGLQHDLSSFLPVLPVSLSLAGNWSMIGAEFTPGSGIDGTLELDGSSYFVGALVGYNLLGMLEVFAEAGWEGASLHSGGHLVITDSDGNGTDQEVNPDLTVDGRNGFRTALNVAFHFGYQAVVGQSVGANMGTQVNLLGFRVKL